MTTLTAQRRPNDSDRLINVHGYSQEFMDTICGLIDDVNNPGWLFVIGPDDSQVELVRNVKRARPDLDDKNWLAGKPGIEKNGAKIPYSLASEDFANYLIDSLKWKGNFTTGAEPLLGKIKAVLLFHQEGKEQWLPHVLRCCERLKVYRVIGDSPNGAMEVSAWEEAIPSSVDLEAAVIQNSDDDARLTSIPDAAIHGRLRDVIDQANAPRGYSYIAALVAASVFVEGTPNIRATLYGATVGGVHTGKTVASDRVRALLGLPDESPLCVRTPYSDRGLFQVCKYEGEGSNKRLLPVDEGRVMFAKGNIQNSTLDSLLCSLWSRNTEGGADKKGLETIKVELSILVNLKVKDESEFPNIFTHATAHGLYDRFLFGVRGDEKWHYQPWDFDATRDVIKLNVTKPRVPGEIFTRAQNWSAAGEDRDRLKEIALRVAYITAAANNDLEVSLEAINAALRLMEWQESIRLMFQPAEGSNEFEECYNAVEAAFKKAPGHAANWHLLSRKHNWNKYYGRVLKTTKKNLEDDGTIVKDKKTGLHYWNKEEKK